MTQSVQTQPFVELVAALRSGGYCSHADRLDDVLNGVWTTSTEMIGELGVVVLAVRKECKPLTPAQRALLKTCAREVGKAWPGFGWFYWWPF